jgi:hypothetical protein
MARFIDGNELFGVGMGYSTCGDLKCDICKTMYNEGNDKTESYNGDSVIYTDFAGLTVCYDCFEAIENEILHRMPDILKWYRKIIKARQKNIDEAKKAFEGL